MTTAELFSRLLSRYGVRDPSKVPFDDALEILGGMNSGLSEYYALAPARFSTMTISTVLPAAVTVSAAVVAGSAAMGSNVFSAGQRGATVVLGDDAGQNEVTGLAAVRDPYLGTTGTVSANVYGDAVTLLAASVKRVLSHPRLDTGAELSEGISSGKRGVGTPRRYVIEHSGEAGGGRDTAILRVDPMPSRAFLVRMEVLVNPLRLIYDDLLVPVTLPVPPHMEHHLIALCRWHLMGLDLFPAQPDTDDKAALARSAIEALAPDAGKSRGKVFTPRGW